MHVRRGWAIAVVAIAVGGLASATNGPAVAAPTHRPKPAWSAAGRSGTVRLTGQVPLAVGKAAAGSRSVASLVGAHRSASSLTLNFVLPLRNRAALDALIQSEAKSHHYESRAALYAEFAPPKAQVDALRSWLEAQGYTITHVSPDRTAVAAKATTAAVERSLATPVNDYVRSGYTFQGVQVPAYRFFSNTANPHVPARLGVQSISGLSDIDRFFTTQQLSAAAQSARTGATVPDGTDFRGSGGAGGYYPEDLRAMYDVDGHGIDATGQVIGFTFWGAGETQAAMDAFHTRTGDTQITVDPACQADDPDNCSAVHPMPNHLENVLENGNDNGAGGTFEFAGNVETALDVEQAHGMAPGAAMKYYLADCTATPPVGSGLSNGDCNGTDVGLEEAVEDAANDPTLHAVSNSWGYGGDAEWGGNDPFRLATGQSFQFAAAAGTTFWFPTGNSGTYESGYPADSPYVAAVGGTSLFSSNTLGTDSTAGVAARSTATTWSGGGSWCSNLEPRPFWQDIAEVNASASCPGRVIPDISAVADPNTGVAFVSSTNSTGGTDSGEVGGTNIGPPVMTGMEAMTRSFLAAQDFPDGTPAIGFEPPTMYQLGTSSHASAYFQDVVCGNTASPSAGPDGDAAGAGWDPATGWGEIDWFNYSTGYALELGASDLTQPASIANNYAYSCAKTPTNAAERGISLPSDAVGYAVGSASGSTPWPAKFLASGSWGASNNFLETTDGGAIWQADNADMMAIACVSASVCTEVGDGGRIRRTTDGGATWTYVPSPDNKALTSITCPTASVCYAAGDRGAVLSSIDAGATWSYVAAAADGNAIYGLACPSATVCYGVDNYAHVEKTTDGGFTWALQSTPVTTPGAGVPGSGGSNPFAGLFGISCTSIDSCVAVGGFPPAGTDAPIVTTTDGGATWLLRTSNSTTTPDLNGVACPDDVTCYAVGRAGVIVMSSDGGADWSPMTSNTAVQLTGITCADAADCVATGQGGTVDVLSNGTWTQVTGQANGLFLASVVCRSASDCVAAGKQGATLAFNPTNVAGSAVLQAGGGTTQQMNGISCVDATDCVAVGNAGTVLTTSNGGQTWLPRTSGTTVSLTGVSCIGSTCEAVGTLSASVAVILGSADGGSTWTPQSSGSTQTLNGVTCWTGTTCVAVGNSGTTLMTSDEGTTWTATASNTTRNLSSVACVSANCYAVGPSGGAGTQAEIIGSTDRGHDWTTPLQVSNSLLSLSAIACSSAVSCVAGGALGVIGSTTDGGAIWTAQSNPLSGPTSALNAGSAGSSALAISAAACSSSTCLFGTGSAGDIMITPVPTVTVTVNAEARYGDNPPLVDLAPNDPSITYSPTNEAADVTGALTCSTTATATSDPATYPVSDCSGLVDPGFTVVYDLADSSYVITKASQTITFAPLASHKFGTSAFTLHATSSSGLPVQFTAESGSACTVAGSTVKLTRAGTCKIDAHQAGNLDWNAAATVTRSFTVTKATPVVRVATKVAHPKFGSRTIVVSVLGVAGVQPTGSVKVIAQGRSCMVTRLSSGSGSCTLVLRPGSVKIGAAYSGNANYTAASGSSKAVTVTKYTPTVTLGASSKPGRGGKQTVTVSETVHGTAGIAPTGTVAVKDGKGQTCTIHLSGGAGHCAITVSPGLYTITARYSGDGNYATVTATHKIKVS